MAATPEHFQRLYRAHFDFVYRNLCRLGLAPAQAEDALQDVFVVALRRIERFEPGTNERGWLFAIAVRVASDHRRSLRRRGDVLQPEGGLPDARAGRAQDPHARLEQREAVARLHACLDRLDPEKRAVFVMTELEQMRAPEIAEALQLNLNTVYTRLRAARKAFAVAAEAVGEGRNDG